MVKITKNTEILVEFDAQQVWIRKKNRKGIVTNDTFPLRDVATHKDGYQHQLELKGFVEVYRWR